ncbi:MAG: hypothetical protein SGPRY_006949 [Prymnesium sp.]
MGDAAGVASLVEGLVLAFCWWRRAGHDRRHVIGHLPILLQELCQAFLWTQMRESDTPRSCSASNRGLSFVITIVVHAVPAAFAVKAWLGMEHNPGIHTRAGIPFRRGLRQVLRQTFCWGVTLPTTTGILMAMGVWTHVCTVRGPHGHQVWPLVMMPIPSNMEYASIIRLVMWGAYFVVVSRPMYMDPAPDIAVAAFNIVGPATVVVLVLWLGDEWGSSWCFLASLLCFFYLLAPLPQFSRFGIAPPDPVARALMYETPAGQDDESLLNTELRTSRSPKYMFMSPRVESEHSAPDVS